MPAISLPATTGGVDSAARQVAELSVAAGLAHDQRYRLRLAVEEIATNIVTHGFAEAAQPVTDPTFDLEWGCDDDWVWVRLSDAARPFDPTSAPEPTDLDAPLSQRRIGGLGIHLVRRSIDDFRYEHSDRRNRVTLGLRRHRATGAV